MRACIAIIGLFVYSIIRSKLVTNNRDIVNIGIFGGTFDPVHNGHIAVAQNACDSYSCAKIIFIPAWLPPHKITAAHMSSATHRIAMLECAINPYNAFELSLIEIEREGTSYTVDTLETLHEQMPNAHFHLIIGADNYPLFSCWRYPKRIHELATVIVHSRPGTKVTDVQPPFRRLTGVECDIGSTEIRKRVACGKSIRHLVPGSTADYIDTHNLYT